MKVPSREAVDLDVAKRPEVVLLFLVDLAPGRRGFSDALAPFCCGFDFAPGAYLPAFGDDEAREVLRKREREGAQV